MNGKELKERVIREIGDRWEESSLHGVVLKESLVDPVKITVIDRTVEDFKIKDVPFEAWLVLEEHPVTQDGYKIIASENGEDFGLAGIGIESDQHPILTGWYGDFWTTFKGM